MTPAKPDRFPWENESQGSLAEEHETDERKAEEQDDGGASVRPATVRYAAMSLLARREHSRLELRQKLLKRFPEPELIDAVIERLNAEALQSDDRFAEAFVSMRKNRGQGPVRIIGELQQRGVTESVYSRYIDPSDDEWVESARAVCLRKYGAFADAPAQRAKQMRFLQYRGFSSEQIRRLWRNDD